MDNKLTHELLEKAKLAKSAEELIALTKENGIELTEEEANTYFAKLNPKTGELADDELDSVAGGRKCGTTYKDHRPVVSSFNCCDRWRCEKCREQGVDRGYCVIHNGPSFCMSCGFSRSESGLLLCYHPERYDN